MPEIKDVIRLVAELRSENCRCGQPKKGGQTFCKPCFRYLPPDVQQGLYLKMGKGYEEARRQAEEILFSRPVARAR